MKDYTHVAIISLLIVQLIMTVLVYVEIRKSSNTNEALVNAQTDKLKECNKSVIRTLAELLPGANKTIVDQLFSDVCN
jgi:hypothetical protein